MNHKTNEKAILLYAVAAAELLPPPPPRCHRRHRHAATKLPPPPPSSSFSLLVIAVIVAVSIAVAATNFSWLLIVVCAPAIAIATGVYVTTVVVRGGSLSAAAAADAIAAALLPGAQRMSGQRWEHCLVFVQLVCCEPPPLSRHLKSSHKLIMCLRFTTTKLVLGPKICASQTHITNKCLCITNIKLRVDCQFTHPRHLCIFICRNQKLYYYCTLTSASTLIFLTNWPPICLFFIKWRTWWYVIVYLHELIQLYYSVTSSCSVLHRYITVPLCKFRIFSHLSFSCKVFVFWAIFCICWYFSNTSPIHPNFLLVFPVPLPKSHKYVNLSPLWELLVKYVPS